jgi:hypothetical protein
MYRTGFFGAIVLTNNGGSTIDYSYNYISINSSTIYSPLISLNNGSSNTRTISGELRLRDASNQIAMNIRTASSEADISYSINGGTINAFVITTISSYKHSNFNILPNINNLVNGTLTFNVINTAPAPPTAVQATLAENQNSANITWNAPTYTGNTAIQSYKLYNNSSLLTPDIGATNITVTNSTENNISYSLTLSTINSAGRESLQSSPPVSFTLIPIVRTGFNGNIQVIASGYSTNSGFVKLFIYADGTPRFEGFIETDTYISIGGDLGPRLLSSSSILYIYAEGAVYAAVTSYELKQYGENTENITSVSPQTINGNDYKGYTIGSALINATLVVYASLIEDD